MICLKPISPWYLSEQCFWFQRWIWQGAFYRSVLCSRICIQSCYKFCSPFSILLINYRLTAVLHLSLSWRRRLQKKNCVHSIEMIVAVCLWMPSVFNNRQIYCEIYMSWITTQQWGEKSIISLTLSISKNLWNSRGEKSGRKIYSNIVSIKFKYLCSNALYYLWF